LLPTEVEWFTPNIADFARVDEVAVVDWAEYL